RHEVARTEKVRFFSLCMNIRLVGHSETSLLGSLVPSKFLVKVKLDWMENVLVISNSAFKHSGIF
ncbi:MAG: hypothetical protein ACYCVB_15345, partial [Bacilli bacterium]